MITNAPVMPNKGVSTTFPLIGPSLIATISFKMHKYIFIGPPKKFICGYFVWWESTEFLMGTNNCIEITYHASRVKINMLNIGKFIL